MLIVSRASRARTAAARWRKQYQHGRVWRDIWEHGGWVSAATTYDALAALGPDPAPDDVDRVIGNRSWTSCGCDECGGEYLPFVVRFGKPDPNYDETSLDVCPDCLCAAVRALACEAGL